MTTSSDGFARLFITDVSKGLCNFKALNWVPIYKEKSIIHRKYLYLAQIKSEHTAVKKKVANHL
jgi:hypothetical protein